MGPRTTERVKAWIERERKKRDRCLKGCQDGSERSIGRSRCSGSEASFKIGIIMFFHLSELEMMTRRLSTLWEQKSVRNASAGFFPFFFFLVLFFVVSFRLLVNEKTDRKRTGTTALLSIYRIAHHWKISRCTAR